jgi:energy-coupling factor transporter ATP-binding protein EcfA2
MYLKSVTIQKFRNFVEPQTIDIEDNVTGLVGKNESGKTTILKALHRLKPANGSEQKFDLTTEYPRWRLAPDRRKDRQLANVCPVTAHFTPSEDDLKYLEEILGVQPSAEVVLNAARSYANEYLIWLSCADTAIIQAAAAQCEISGEDLDLLMDEGDIEAAPATARARAKELKDVEPLRAKALNAFPTALQKHRSALKLEEDDVRNQVERLVPSFFYFSSYNLLPGECDLTELARKVKAEESLDDRERSVVALLAHAGESPEDFMDADYDSRKAELQAASTDLSHQVFEYWRQNPDLGVVFDTDNVVVQEQPSGNQITHRYLKIELRDGRHGDVETNFSTRSTGFQWFFSFFAAFSEYQDSEDEIVVLLDEPGTSLHGDAQRDFVRFIFSELGSSKQTLYTTHSQHMIDPTKYEKLRAVHDRATRNDPDQGVVVSRIDLTADKATLLPVESAIGYSVSQHLFLGSGQHLAVEGSSDFVYLQRFTEYLIRKGEEGLDPRLAIIPVGGVDNMPAFVALLGRRLKVSALVDGARTSNKVARIKAAAEHNNVPVANIITCAEADDSLPTNADIEDLFEASDYLRLYNWTFDKHLKLSDLASTSEPILKRIADVEGTFDHALPAHTLTQRRAEFFDSVNPGTVENFRKIFKLLNGTIVEDG